MSSSEDEIMEISNLPSSSNNYVSKSSETVPVDKAISLPPKTTNTIIAKISSPSASRINKRYQSKFKKEWLSNSYFSTFLRECKTDQTKAVKINHSEKYNEPVLNIGYQIQSIHTKKTIKLLSNFCLLYRGPYESNKSTVTSIPVVSQTTKSRPKSVTSPRPMSKEASEFAESGTYKPLYRRHSSY
ncbi:unnamed protein product [Rotaria socialis]|uniref:Uncharacterized protein n=1 Tax=Rotaria socialis TaxID=392032 RepID=A0A818M4Q9_9BILA|nr:unnamed protein product [Rotaria socialis]